MLEVPKLRMNNGQSIPQVGFGMWRIKDEQECIDSIVNAYKAGYRHFDTAQIYMNEQFLGEALKQLNAPREEVFITSKIWNDNQWWENFMPSFDESLQKLQTDYVDMFLVHSPETKTRTMAWRRMEQVYKEGTAKSIGVSNYTIKHLEELMSKFDIVPAVNQVELHVFLQQPELVEFCAQHGILIEAYSPLAHGLKMNDMSLQSIAKKHGKTYAQIMLRWLIEQNMIILPKSVHEKRIIENINIFDFELDGDDIEAIKHCEADFRTCWDPTNIA